MKVGVIGLGSIGMRHTNNINKLGHEVLGHDPYLEVGGIGLATYSINNLINECDSFIISSPTNTHYKYIEKLIKTKKPILVEKPIAFTSGEMDILLTSNHMGWLDNVYVGNNLRFHPCVIQAEEWLKEGLILDPLWASIVVAQFSSKAPYLRDGVVLNWGAHEVDLALHLLGPARVACAAVGTTGGYEDITDFVLVHEGGNGEVRSNIHLDYLTEPEIRQTIICGDQGSIILDLVNRQAWVRGPEGLIADHADHSNSSFDDDYVAEMEDFLNGGKHMATAKEGLDTLAICLEVRKKATA